MFSRRLHPNSAFKHILKARFPEAPNFDLYTDAQLHLPICFIAVLLQVYCR